MDILIISVAQICYSIIRDFMKHFYSVINQFIKSFMHHDMNLQMHHIHDYQNHVYVRAV